MTRFEAAVIAALEEIDDILGEQRTDAWDKHELPAKIREIHEALKPPPPPEPEPPKPPEPKERLSAANERRIAKHQEEEERRRNRYPHDVDVACDACGSDLELLGPLKDTWHSWRNHWGLVRCKSCGIEGKLAHCFIA